jgi:putative FmdB family regulatory protein
MPLYDYRCSACGQTFEIRATFKEKERGLHPRCPACESMETQQLVSAPMVVRAGPGDAASALPLGCAPSAGPGCC